MLLPCFNEFLFVFINQSVKFVFGFALILISFVQCSNRFQDALKTEKGLGIEYDEDVICDVCRSVSFINLVSYFIWV